MPLWLARWPNNDVVVAEAGSKRDMLSLLDEAGDPGEAQVERYQGPFCIELRPKLPGSWTHEQGYLRPHAAQAAAAQADPLRQRLWARQQEGALCDITLAAANGEERRAHRVVLCAVCPALEERLGQGHQVALHGVPSGQVLEALLEWLYLGRATFNSAAAEAVLPLALALGLPWLAEECDFLLAQRITSPFDVFAQQAATERSLEALVDLLALAHRHGRQRLLTYCLRLVPQGSWATLRGLPAFAALPPELQRSLAAAAHQTPPLVLRTPPQAMLGGGGRVDIGVSARAYREAGGELTAVEAAELAEYEQALAAAAATAPGPAGAADAAGAAGAAGTAGAAGLAGTRAAAVGAVGGRAAVPLYEISAEQATGSRLFQGEDGKLPYELNPNPDYEAAWTFEKQLTRFAFPHTAAEVQRQQSFDYEWEPPAAPGLMGPSDQRLSAAAVTDLQAVARQSDERAKRAARLMVAAERGDHQAAQMLRLNLTTPCVLADLMGEEGGVMDQIHQGSSSASSEYGGSEYGGEPPRQRQRLAPGLGGASAAAAAAAAAPAPAAAAAAAPAAAAAAVPAVPAAAAAAAAERQARQPPDARAILDQMEACLAKLAQGGPGGAAQQIHQQQQEQAARQQQQRQQQRQRQQQPAAQQQRQQPAQQQQRAPALQQQDSQVRHFYELSPQEMQLMLHQMMALLPPVAQCQFAQLPAVQKLQYMGELYAAGQLHAQRTAEAQQPPLTPQQQQQQQQQRQQQQQQQQQQRQRQQQATREQGQQQARQAACKQEPQQQGATGERQQQQAAAVWRQQQQQVGEQAHHPLVALPVQHQQQQQQREQQQQTGRGGPAPLAALPEGQQEAVMQQLLAFVPPAMQQQFAELPAELKLQCLQNMYARPDVQTQLERLKGQR